MTKNLQTPRQIDPTQTITLRQRFSEEINRRFARLNLDIDNAIVRDDSFGLKDIRQSFAVNKAYSYCSTQLNIVDPKVLAHVQVTQERLRYEDIVKKETQPHITVRYGLLESPKQRDKVMALLNGVGTMYVRFGKLSLFSTPDADVLKYEVFSQQLEELNRQLALLPNISKFRVYSPHMTIAYLKPGTGANYVGTLPNTLKDDMIAFKEVQFSNTDGTLTSIALNVQWSNQSIPDQVKAFQVWIEAQINDKIMKPESWYTKYLETAYMKGVMRAYRDTMGLKSTPDGLSQFVRGLLLRKPTYVANARAKNPHAIRDVGGKFISEKVKTLAVRLENELKGATTAMSQNISRVLIDGLERGLKPRTIAIAIESAVKDIGRNRALLIANTEIVRAHAEGQLDAMEELGVDEVGAKVEWSTAHDGKVCPLCSPLQGVVLKIAEARGMIPRHPRCRCAWYPTTKPEPEQVRSKRGIQRAIRKSMKAEGAEDDNETEWGPAEPILARNQEVIVVNQQPGENALSYLSRWIVENAKKAGKGGAKGRWVTTKDGHHLFLSDKGTLHLHPSGPSVDKSKGDEKHAEPPKIEPKKTVVTESPKSHGVKSSIGGEGSTKPTAKDVQELGAKLPGGFSGHQVNHDPGVGMISEKGVHQSGANKTLVSMTDGHCHWNSAELFKSGKIDAVVIGYAQHPDNGGRWHQHTWGVKDGKVVETTASNKGVTKYFGVPLSKADSQAFADHAAQAKPGMGKMRYTTNGPTNNTETEYIGVTPEERVKQPWLSFNSLSEPLDLMSEFLTNCGGKGGKPGPCPKPKSPATKIEKTATVTIESTAGKPAGTMSTPAEHAAVVALAKAKAATNPAPTAEEKLEAKKGLAELGANKYRKNLVGNSVGRAIRRKALYKEFGDGVTCPCVYCGVRVGEGTLEQDKIKTTAEGGRYRMPNLIPSCSGCNKVRSDMKFDDAIASVKINTPFARQEKK